MDNKRTYYKKWWFWGIGVICIVLVIAITSSPKNNSISASNIATSSLTQNAVASATASPVKTVTPTATPSPTVTKTSEPKPTFYKSGMYKVGTDIPAGEYVLIANPDAYGVYRVSKDSTGTYSSLVVSDSFKIRSIITVDNGQYFQSYNCTIYPYYCAPKVVQQDGKYVAGTYKVGVDIPEGEYRIIVVDAKYGVYRVYKDSYNLYSSQIASDSFEDKSYVTVKNGQYLVIYNAYIIK